MSVKMPETAPVPFAVLSLVIAVAVCGTSSAATGPEQELVSRHRALIAAINRQDMNAVRGFYLPSFQGESGGKKIDLKQQLAGLAELIGSEAKIHAAARLTNVAVNGDSATAVEIADLSIRQPDGTRQIIPTQRSEQHWTRVKGVWKLAREKLLPGGQAPAPAKTAR